jgi:uncharacterized repeat protein (TIGR01451 family)
MSKRTGTAWHGLAWWRQAGGVLACLVMSLVTAAQAAGVSIDVPAGYRYGAPADALAAAPGSVRRVTASPADPTDPAVVAKATALNHDPALIFAFVRDQIVVDPYPGSLRGARGTLAGMAGNALDRSSLAIALLRASGYTARYAQGTLTYADAQRVVARAFPDAQRMVGCNNPGARAVGSTDYYLVTPIQLHTWLQYQAVAAGPWIDLDTSFAGSTAGQAFTTTTATFDEVPDNQQHHVRVRVMAETFSQAGAVYGFGLGTTTVLDATYAASDLVDKPLTLGHFVAHNAPPALAVGSITNTYSPYLLVGNNQLDPGDYPVFRGTDYVETFTNFPLGTVLLTGVFVTIDEISPQDAGNPKTSQRVLVDRIGYATRVNGGSVASPASDAPPPITPLDLMTIQVAPSKQPLDGFAQRQSRLQSLQSQTAALAPTIATLPPPAQQSPAQVSLRTQATDLNRRAVIAILELMTASFEGAASRSNEDTAATFLSRIWIATPRLTIATSHIGSDALSFALDLRRNDLVVYPLNGIAFVNGPHFERARGMQESLLEAQVLTAVTGQPARSFASLLQASADLVPITRYDTTRVDDLSLSEEAKARIRDTVTGNTGRSVLAPRAPVVVNGKPYSVWLESDPNTGYTISTGEDGTHQALGEYAGLLLDLFGVDSLETQMAKFIGQVNSAGVVGVAFTAAVVQAISSGNAFTGLAQAVKAILNDSTGALAQMIKLLEDSGASEYCEGGCGLVQSMLSGLLEGVESFKAAIGAGDPPVPAILMAPPLPPLPTPVAPGASPGLTMSMVQDTRYFVPYNGAELPFVYLVKITNTGPATDTFRVDGSSINSYYGFTTAQSQITLAAGASGEVGLCLNPNGPLPPAGTPLPIGVHVYSNTNPGVEGIFTDTKVMPSAKALRVRLLPPSASVHPGDTASATLTLDSLGNAQTDVALSSASDAGLSVTGLPASLALNAGESRSLPLSYHIAGSAAPGESLVSVLSGDIGGVVPATARFTANLTSTLTTCTAQAAIDATRLGRTAMGASLVRLAAAMDRLAGHPADAGDLGSALAELDELIHNQLTSNYLTSVLGAITAARAQLAVAPSGSISSALANVDASLCPLGSALLDAASGDLSIGLNPALAVSVPAQPVVVNINLYNDTLAPRTFDVALSGVPANVQAELSATTVNIPSHTQSNGCCSAPTLSVTLTNNDGLARAFDYRVTVTPRDLPQLSRGITGSVTLRQDIVRVASVRATPIAVDPGTAVTISTRVMNSANGYRTVFGAWVLKDSTGTARRSGGTDSKLLASGDGVVALSDFTIDTAGLSGAYTLEMSVVDTAHCCSPISGASGTGSFLVGQPFSAQLAVTPASVAPGTSAIHYDLALSHESAPTPVIDARASLAMPDSTRSFVQHGHYLYVCQRNQISIVDVQTPNTPVIVGTFATTGVLDTGYGNAGCNLDGDVLVVAYNLASPSSFDDLKLVSYLIDTAHATAPQKLNATPVTVPKRFGGNIQFNAGHQGSLITTAIIYNPFSGFIGQQNGNLISLDFSAPATPVQTGELFHHFGAGDSNDAIYGGPNMVFASLPRGSTTLLASTSAVGDGFGTGPGVGRIIAANINQLTTNCPGAVNPCISGSTDIAGTRLLFGIQAQGNAGLAVGDTDGFYDGRSGMVGHLTLSALDLSGPLPVVQSTLTSLMLNRRPDNSPCNQPLDIGGTSLTALTANYYAVGAFNPLSCSWVLAIVDANDPQHLAIVPYDVPSVLRSVVLDGGKMYALTDTAILVYDYSVLAGPAITAHVDIPKGTGVAVNAFVPAPTSVDTSAGDHDRYTWYRPTATHLVWEGTVSGMTPGELRTVATGGGVDYTLPSIGAGTLQLEHASVSANQTLAITPARQVNALAQPLTYTITLTNPGAGAVSYDLSLLGLPPGWLVHLDTPVSVPALGQATASLVLQSGLSDPQYTDFPFSVVGVSSSGFTTSGQAVLGTSGRDIGPNGNNPVLASTLEVLTDPISVGRGDGAPIAVRTANVGNTAQNYSLGLSAAPGGISATFLQPSYAMNAGATHDVSGSVFVAPNMAPGSYPVTLYLNSNAGLQYRDFTISVPGPGVQVGVNPPSGTPATSFTAHVTNSGMASDTFDLSTLGPLGPAATLTPATVTLAAGDSQDVTATLSGTTALPPGTTSFDVQAISRALPAARARATAQVTLGNNKAMTLSGVPSTLTAPTLPASGSFGVRIANGGNVEDAYSLAITGTTGNLTASLHDGSGSSVASVAPVRLPGNAAAQFRVDATLAAGGSETGTVTLKATSQSDAAITSSVVLTYARNGAANILVNTPGELDFGNQALSSTSAMHSVNLINSGAGNFVIGSATVLGTNSGDFHLASGSNACSAGGTIAANGGSCTLYASFAPLALGARAARIDVVNSGASVTISVPMQGTGVDGNHLGAELTVNRNVVQYLHTLSYLVTARNPGPTAVAGVSVSLPLPVQFVAGSASWFCINAGDPNAVCASAGSGALADSNVVVPAQGSVSYVVSGLVSGVTLGETISATAHVTSTLDPGPYTASASTVVVIYRDGFELFGDGAESLRLIALGQLDANGSLLLRVPNTLTAHFIETIAEGRDRSTGRFRVERVGTGGRYWVRLVTETGGTERSGEWLPVPADGIVGLASVTRDAGTTLLLQAGNRESSVDWDGAAPEHFDVTASDGSVLSDAQ